MARHTPSFIESLAEKLRLIPNLHDQIDELPPIVEPGNLTDYPPPEKWDHWTEYGAKSGQRSGYDIIARKRQFTSEHRV